MSDSTSLNPEDKAGINLMKRSIKSLGKKREHTAKDLVLVTPLNVPVVTPSKNKKKLKKQGKNKSVSENKTEKKDVGGSGDANNKLMVGKIRPKILLCWTSGMNLKWMIALQILRIYP